MKWPQRIDLGVLVRRETFQDVGQPTQRIESVELGGGNQALDGCGVAAWQRGGHPVGADAKLIHAADCN